MNSRLITFLFWICEIYLLNAVSEAQNEQPETTEIKDKTESFDNELQKTGEPDVTISRELFDTLVARLEKLEDQCNKRKELTFEDYLLISDEFKLSYLELGFQKLKTTVFNSVPPTSKECKFSWKKLYCVPKCSCDFQPQFGDYSLDRMCRMKPEDQENSTCDSTSDDDDRNVFKVFITRTKETLIKHFLTFRAKIVSQAPFSDDVCRWDFKAMTCTPAPYCYFDYQVGDYSLNRACRLKVDLDWTEEELWQMEGDEMDAESDFEAESGFNTVNEDHVTPAERTENIDNNYTEEFAFDFIGSDSVAEKPTLSDQRQSKKNDKTEDKHEDIESDFPTGDHSTKDTSAEVLESDYAVKDKTKEVYFDIPVKETIPPRKEEDIKNSGNSESESFETNRGSFDHRDFSYKNVSHIEELNDDNDVDSSEEGTGEEDQGTKEYHELTGS